MRVSGRGGLCSVPGAGVWCDETVGVVCSGYGECFIRTLFAREMCEAVRENREAHVTEGLRRLEKDQQHAHLPSFLLWTAVLLSRGESSACDSVAHLEDDGDGSV